MKAGREWRCIPFLSLGFSALAGKRRERSQVQGGARGQGKDDSGSENKILNQGPSALVVWGTCGREKALLSSQDATSEGGGAD